MASSSPVRLVSHSDSFSELYPLLSSFTSLNLHRSHTISFRICCSLGRSLSSQLALVPLIGRLRQKDSEFEARYFGIAWEWEKMGHDMISDFVVKYSQVQLFY